MEDLKTGDHRRFKDELYTEFARIGQALASPKRLEILDLLAQREWPVEKLAREMDLTVANASQHLHVLLRARLVEVRREGTRAYYRLAAVDVYRLWQAVRDLGEARLAEVPAVIRRYLGDREDIQVLNVAELLQRVEGGDVILLDVRPEEEYRAGHIPGARPLTLAELMRALKTLPKNRDLVVYCRGRTASCRTKRWPSCGVRDFGREGSGWGFQIGRRFNFPRLPKGRTLKPVAGMPPGGAHPVTLGLRANLAQFSLLVLINAFVGGMVGLERTVLPLIAERDFGLASKSVILSFLVSFGIVKALTNLLAAGTPTSWAGSGCWSRDG